VFELVFYLVKETPKGYWISSYRNYDKNVHLTFLGDYPRWVSKTSRKRYAYPTREEALEGFKARKRRQIAILKNRLEQAQAALFYAERMERPRGY